MKLTTITNVSLDGVTQGHRRIETRSGPDAPDEEGRGKFERFGWRSPRARPARCPCLRCLCLRRRPPVDHIGQSPEQDDVPFAIYVTNLADP